MKTHQQHVDAHSKALKDRAVRTELCLVLYKLGIKSAKPNINSVSALNDLFKQVYSGGITDILLGQPNSTLFGIDPQTYNTWKNNGKTTT